MRMATAILNPTAVKSFPEKDLTDAIISWWTEEMSRHTDDPFAAAGTLYDVPTNVDSLSAVNVLLVLEPIVGCSLPESLIKPGDIPTGKKWSIICCPRSAPSSPNAVTNNTHTHNVSLCLLNPQKNVSL